MRSFPKVYRAFTLTELLVAISIIAILALILFPLIGSVIRRGYATKSLSNKRVIYSAFALYHAENGHLPPLNNAKDTGSSITWDTSTGWSATMAPYLEFTAYPQSNNHNVMVASDILYCPAQDVHNTRRGDYGVAYNENTYGGPIRKDIKDDDGKKTANHKGSLSFSDIKEPGKAPLLADCEQYGGGELVGSWFFDPSKSTYAPAAGSNPVLSFRHDGKVQMVFADGSSGSYTVEELFRDVLPWDNR